MTNYNSSTRAKNFRKLRKKSSDGGFPSDDLSKIFRGYQRVAKVPNGEEKLPKIPTGWVGRMNVSRYRQTTDRQTDDSILANVNVSER